VSESGPAATGNGVMAPGRSQPADRIRRAAALPDGGFGWLDVNGDIDLRRPRPLYINARMTYVFALAHLGRRGRRGCAGGIGDQRPRRPLRRRRERRLVLQPRLLPAE